MLQGFPKRTRISLYQSPVILDGWNVLLEVQVSFYYSNFKYFFPKILP